MTVYFIGSDCGRVKIGYTGAESPEARLRDLQVGSARKLSLIVCCEGSRQQETLLHRKLADSNPHGEWFEPSPKLASVIAFAKRFGNVRLWDEAEENPEAWAEMVAAAGRRPGTELALEEEALQHRWEQAMVSRAARIRRDVDWYWAWCMAAGRSNEIASIVEHRIAEYSGDGDSFEWRDNCGRTLRGTGLETTVDALAGCAGNEERVAAIWIAACVHDLSRSESARIRLAECFPGVDEFSDTLSALSRVSWMRLQLALPEPLFVPKRCVLSVEEFVSMCAQHCRLLLSGSRVLRTWRHGAAQGFTSSEAA